jgi:hypothetical protein
MRLGQHRHRRYAGDGTRGFDSQTPHHLRIRLSPLPLAQLSVPLDKLALGEDTPIGQRVPAQNMRQTLRREPGPSPHLLQDSDEQVFQVFQIERFFVRRLPGISVLFTHP